jgi:uncharacterized membrane protein YdbT with pleckstrin-like domain
MDAASVIKEPLDGKDAAVQVAGPHEQKNPSDILIENENQREGAAQMEGSAGEEEAGEPGEEAEDEEEESSEEEEDVVEDGASEEDNDYEAQRQRNIERNQAMLRQLGLLVNISANVTTSILSAATTSTSPSSALLPTADTVSTLAAGFSLQTPKRKYKPRQKRNVDTPTRTSSRLQTKVRPTTFTHHPHTHHHS